MARPRYQITESDWLDCLEWVEHQLNQTQWARQSEHPVHSMSMSDFKSQVQQWRKVRYPSKSLLNAVQDMLEQAFTIEDWGRLRKALSARKRRRREQRMEQKSVNITLTPNAHRMITEYRNLTGCQTISEAVEDALADALKQAADNAEQLLGERIVQQLMQLKASEIVEVVAKYLDIAAERRTLANTCKIAFQLFSKRPDRESLKLVCDRFSEDLIWNQIHLNVSYESLALFNRLTDGAHDLESQE